MIKSSLRQLCLLSVFCGAALSLSPEGNVKKLMQILVSAVLILAILSPLKEMDFSVYALSTAKLREKEAALSENGALLARRISRPVIEEEYRTYIMDKAAQLGLNIQNLKIGVYWSTEGLWLPEWAELSSEGAPELKNRLENIISRDLGIAPERQYWDGRGRT